MGEKLFNIRDKDHRMISAFAGQLQWTREYHLATPEDKATAAENLREQVERTLNGQTILSEVIADAEAAKRRYRLEAEAFRTANPRTSDSLVEAAS